ncbi:hypothetical protein BROUX41_003657 [Berkeleyomyces rouxiae]|uniref:uncharacterized protein n=1 Tax=Berkeleyomyces rouxiae TaxID=2035830 RepID=UPI003B761AFC
MDSLMYQRRIVQPPQQTPGPASAHHTTSPPQDHPRHHPHHPHLHPHHREPLSVRDVNLLASSHATWGMAQGPEPPPALLLRGYANQQLGPAVHPLPLPQPPPCHSQTAQKPSTFPSQAPDLSQHQLRRKTPSGTIDAGYDGSHVYMDPGPPAYKHVLLPSSSFAPTAATEAYVLSRPHPQQQQPLQASGFVDNLMPPSAHAHNLAPHHHANHALFSLLGTGTVEWSSHTQIAVGGSHASNLLLAGQLPAAQAASMHYYGYGPPSPAIGAPLHPAFLQPLSSIFHTAQGNAFQRHTPSNQTYHRPDPSTLRQAPVANGPLASPWLGGMPQPPSYAFPQMHPHKPPPMLTLETLNLVSRDYIPSSSGTWTSGLAGYSRDQALANAHRAYLLLIAHTQPSRKVAAFKNGDISKQYVFPKPPRTSHMFRPSAPSSMNMPDQHVNHTTAARATEDSTVDKSPFASAPQPHAPPVSSANAFSAHNRNVSTTLCPPSTAPAPFFAPVPTKAPASPIFGAQNILDALTALCEQSAWQWVDGIIIGGCLHYALERYGDAMKWFRLALGADPQRVEAISNLAATMYTIGMTSEAEAEWLRALRISPGYLDSAEHLIGLIYNRHPKEAVDAVEFVQSSLRMQDPPTFHDSSASGGFGSSGYSIPGCDNGRLVGLIHAKGSLLYSLREIKTALDAFEEAVMISTGKRSASIYSLVRDIQYALSPISHISAASSQPPSAPLLLLPEKARQTAHLLFSGNGQLPGLKYVPDGNPRRASMQATSSSLLSLAKILQDSLSSNPAIATRPAGVGDILALYYLSLSLQESPSTANNVGILLAAVQQPTGHPTTGPNLPTTLIPGITPGSGLSFALAYYEYGLRLDPQHVHLHTNLGSLLKDVGQLDMAIRVYEKAVSCDGTFDIALTNLANAVKDRGRIQDAIGYYKRAVVANPSFAEAVCGLFTALNSVCDWRGRGGVMLDDGKLDRWHVNEAGGLIDACQQNEGSGLTKRVADIVRKQIDEASNWGKGIITQDVATNFANHISRLLKDPTATTTIAIKIRGMAGSPFEGSQIVRLLERVSRVAMWHWYMDRKAGTERPPEVYARLPVPAALTIPATPTILPFHTFTCPLEASHIRIISQRNAMRTSCSTLRSPWLPTTVYPPPAPPNPQLIVGYVSSDFNNHPLAHLMQSVFGFHDSSKVKAICYATTPSDTSSHRLKIEREAPVFHDASSWSSPQLIQQIVSDGVHILVNLNGYTRGARNEVFAARPAPIQMSFMGFAGTMGAEWCDYLLADNKAIPPTTLRPSRNNMSVDAVFQDENDKPEGDWIYSENIIFTRDTFFCCDHAQSAEPEERHITWAEEERRRWELRRSIFPQLADDVIIMGNFNQLYKIDPTTFRTWLRILSQAPKAVLWLLRFPELGEANLKRTAQEWAGSSVADRIIFTDVAQKQHHISRARVCDLFLDTAECNAHTTAADILWSSTPLLTLPRYPYKMCSRMASSILSGALPRTNEGLRAAAELTATNEDEYERSAVQLVNSLRYSMTSDGYGVGQGRLFELRKLLFDNRWTCGLFDTQRWVRDLEESFSLAWDRWERCEPGDIFL